MPTGHRVTTCNAKNLFPDQHSAKPAGAVGRGPRAAFGREWLQILGLNILGCSYGGTSRKPGARQRVLANHLVGPAHVGDSRLKRQTDQNWGVEGGTRLVEKTDEESFKEKTTGSLQSGRRGG